jgi:hypothetical protein
MLRRLASGTQGDGFPAPPTPDEILSILRLDPVSVALLLETGWRRRVRGAPSGVDPAFTLYSGAAEVSELEALLDRIADPGSVLWDHLIYAYLVENTRIIEIFSRAVRELLHGERLGIPQLPDTYRWLRTTEELFLKDASPFQPQALVSRVRPDAGASRRNAYYRMFAMDLNHSRDAGAYQYEKAEAANRDFVMIFEEFLREVWRGIENANNLSGPNVADPEAIASHAVRLQNMLIARRGSPATGRQNLAREEFEFVNMMAWFHLTVLIDSPVVQDLRATAPSPEERLRLIGERAGVPAHAKSHSYFILAPAMSTLLIQIEAGDYSNGADAPNLYAPGTNPIRDMVASIINHWSMATGRDLKSPRLVVGTTSAAAARSMVRTSTLGAAPAGANGRTPAEVGA